MKKGLAQVLLANIVFLLVGIISNFLLPKYLSVDSYSFIKTYALYISYAGFFHFGYNDGMYLKYGGRTLTDISSKDIGINFFNYIVVLCVASMCLLIVGLSIHNFVLSMFAIGVFATNFICYFKSLAQAVGEYGLYGKSLNYEKVLILVFDIGLIFFFKTDDYKYYLIAQVAASIIISIILFVNVNRKKKLWNGWKFSFSEISKNIKQGYVLMLGNFSSSLFTGLDRWFVKMLMSTLVFAQYSFAVSVEQIINVFITPITVSMYNYFCREKNTEKIILVKKYVVIWGCLVIAGAFPLKIIIELILPKYEEASNLIFILFAAHAFYTVIKGVYVNYYKSKSMQNLYFKQLIGMTLTAFITNCIGYYIFRSMYAIATATFLTAVLWYILCEFLTKELRGKIKDNIAFVLVIAIYLLLGLRLNAVIGCICYLCTLLFILIIFMGDTLREIIGEIRSLYRQYINKEAKK